MILSCVHHILILKKKIYINKKISYTDAIYVIEYLDELHKDRCNM